MHDNKCNAATMLLPPLNVLKFMAIIKIHFHRAARVLLAPTTGRITESRHIKCCFLTCECVCGVCVCVCVLACVMQPYLILSTSESGIVEVHFILLHTFQNHQLHTRGNQ